ncbi:MAG TPA: NAD(P)-binding protein [Clostridiales bacterium]|nr:NAD(P)-binding protein [Clostridiales bacterium]
MIRINGIKLPIRHTKEDMIKSIGKALRISTSYIKDYNIIKQSIDARKAEVKYTYTVDVIFEESYKEKEITIVKHSRNSNVSIADLSRYDIKPNGTSLIAHRPVVVGTGPAGLFCALLLAKHGYEPLVIERGEEVDKRVKTVEGFWAGQDLNPESNVQFGEGGAGTFSDGKLNTNIRDNSHRYGFVLESFVAHGAPSEILYLNKPHIGTDLLRDVVKNIRNEIIALGGEVRFGAKLTDLIIEDNTLKAIEINGNEQIPCNVLIPALGHSARDTFDMFLSRGLTLLPKPFAIGLRVEHPQEMINHAQYGKDRIYLPPADYKLTHQSIHGRGVYSFCMCPGGYVVNASSEPGHLAVNGMSNHARDGVNANSAIVVTVRPEDFGGDGPLSGIEFQRKIEKRAYEIGQGKVPIQLFGDLLRDKESVTIGNITPNIKGGYKLANLKDCLPKPILDDIIEGIQVFDRKIEGFGNEEIILSGVESRTSSPVRILRDEALESNIKGIYPCGEGAGYAGGITSAAIDGIRVYEAIARKYKPI